MSHTSDDVGQMRSEQGDTPIYVPRWLRAGGAWGVRLIAIAVCVIGFAKLAVLLQLAVLPVVLGLILAALLQPIANLLRSARLPSALAGLLAVLVGLASVAGVIVVVAISISEEQGRLGEAISQGYGDLVRWAAETFGLSDNALQSWIDQNAERLRSSATSAASRVVSGLADVATTFSVVALSGVFGWFFLWNGERLFQTIVGFLPGKYERHMDELGGRLWHTVGAYMRGMLIIAFADAILLGIGLAIVGMPMILPLMLLLFVGAFVPYAGAILAGAATGLVGLASGGLSQAGFAILVAFVVQQIEGNLLQPFIMARAVKLEPAIVLFAVTAGGALSGVVGVFLAVPLTACGVAILLYAREQEAL